MPKVYYELKDICNRLEMRFKYIQYVEFAVENSKLFILESNKGNMTPEATVRVAVDMVNEGLISKKTALSRIDPAQLEFFYSDMIDSEGTSTPVFCKGLVISPGVDIFFINRMDYVCIN